MTKLFRSVKVEMWKATHNQYFYTSLGIALILVILNIITVRGSISTATEMILEGREMGIPFGSFKGCSLFLWWISSNMNQYSSLYYQLFPIIAAMPFGWSFCQEMRNGLMVQYALRSDRKTAVLAKYIAVFCSGGIVVAFPVLLDLLANALICPDESLLFYNPMTMIFSKTLLSKLFFLHPWIWSLIWCGVDFLLGGSSAVLCFIAGKRIRFSALVILIPYIIYYILAVFILTFQNFVETEIMLDPFYIPMAQSFGPVPGWLIFLECGIFIGLSWIVTSQMVKKDDLI